MMMPGSQRTIPGKAINTPIVIISAKKNGVTPRNTSCTDNSGRTPATTKQFKPMGGVIKQNSAIVTTMIPNHMAHPTADTPKAESRAVTSGPPFRAITAGKTTGSVNNNIPIAETATMLKATQMPDPNKNSNKEIKNIVKYISVILNLFSYLGLKKLNDEIHK